MNTAHWRLARLVGSPLSVSFLYEYSYRGGGGSVEITGLPITYLPFCPTRESICMYVPSRPNI